MRVVVVGGGIAGLVAAHAAAQLPGATVTLVEREPQLLSHASGRNAAIYRPLEAPAVVSRLASASATLLDELCGARGRWLRPAGLLLTATTTTAALASLAAVADDVGVDARLEDGRALGRRVPALVGGSARAGLWLPGAGVLDGHAIAGALAAAVRAAGGNILLGHAATRLEPGAPWRVHTAGPTLQADAVVIAGGAWAAALGAGCGAPLPLVPMRRHLAMLAPEATAALAPDAPTVWDVELGCYLRPESGAVLASPGDASPWLPGDDGGDPPTDPDALTLLAERLGDLAPALASARVRRSWACLRTFAPDHAAVVGADPRAPGLFWLAGLGGHGMSGALGAGAVLRAALGGGPHPLAAALAPARLLG
jgi:D-arginine dehydrogenase